MRYRVSFAKRFESDGEPSDIDPTNFLDLPEGVVTDKVLVETLEPESMHSQDDMDEDDAFLGRAAAEVWEYGVTEGREDEFETALEASGTVMEFDRMDVDLMDVSTDSDNNVRAGAPGSPGHEDTDVEGLSVVSETDPSLGLTDIGAIPADDWAANTGPTRNPAAGRGVGTKGMTDRSSTLKQ